MENITDALERIMNQLGELQRTNQAELDACREENRQLRLGINVPVINPKLPPNSKFIPLEDGVTYLIELPNIGFQNPPFNSRAHLAPRPHKMSEYTIYEKVTHPREGFNVLGHIINGLKEINNPYYDTVRPTYFKLRFINNINAEYFQILPRKGHISSTYQFNGREVQLYYDPNELPPNFSRYGLNNPRKGEYKYVPPVPVTHFDGKGGKRTKKYKKYKRRTYKSQ